MSILETMRAIYFDTETTGLKPEKDRIIEIAAYDPLQDRSFVSLINPNCPIPPEASAIHRITDEMVKDAPDFTAVAAGFLEFCGEGAILIAHNNDAFDKPFLEEEFKRSKIPFPGWRFIDTLKWARKYRPDLPRHALQFLREVYGIPANQAHRALDDVIVLHRVFSSMIDDLPIEKVLDLLLKKPKLNTRMPFGKHQGKPLSEVPRDYVKWLLESGAFDRPDNHSLKDSFEKLGFL